MTQFPAPCSVCPNCGRAFAVEVEECPTCRLGAEGPHHSDRVRLWHIHSTPHGRQWCPPGHFGPQR